MKGKLVLISSYYYHPCTHPVLENVFAKELGRLFKIVWFLQGDRSKGDIVRWHNSSVHITPMMNGSGFFRKVMNRVLSYYKLVLILKFSIRNKADIILIRDLPLEATILSFLKSIFGFRLYYQHSAPLGEILIGYSEMSFVSVKLFLRLRGYLYNIMLRKALKKSDLIFPISESQKEDLSAQINQNRLVPISMGVDEDRLKTKPNTVTLLENLKKRYCLIGYIGTLNFTRTPKFILDVFANVKSEYPMCKLILIGKTATIKEWEELAAYSRFLDIQEDVIFTGYLSRDKVYDHLVLFDLTISPIPPVDYFINSSPTKVYESLGAGVPVVANEEILEQKRVINESGGGKLVQYKVEQFSMAIVEILNDRRLREQMSSMGHEYVIHNYSYRKIAERIAPYFLYPGCKKVCLK